MSTDKVAKEIRSAIDALAKERDEIAARISILEDTLAKLGGAKRGPGRPKGSGAKAAGSATKPARKKPHWSPEARKAAKERMQKYWADRKKKAGKKA
ncbi:MAG: hypothetical protein H6730_27620 [Deltaproteobacteria bacterium]|nr:hypothetical protein [Deltaproteobacteria bacterium]